MQDGERARRRHHSALKVALLILVVAVVGLPVNHAAAYLVLVVAAVVIFSGELQADRRAVLAALAFAAIAIGGRTVLATAPIEEGHNVFLPGASALERGLPAAVYRQMVERFDAVYPPAVRCQPGTVGCWQGQQGPDTVFAFSADGIWTRTDASRAVRNLDFADPVWLHLGFINDIRYNWYTLPPDVHRADRDRRFFMGWRRWHLAMPWFEMIRLPPAFTGGEVCWRGAVMWEDASAAFSLLPEAGCRAVAPDDAGRRIFGIAIAPDTLVMQVKPPWDVRLRNLAAAMLRVAAIAAVLLLLVRLPARRLIVPALLLGLSVVMIVVDDASFLGGMRPFDGGDDGLFYDGTGRMILQKLLAGDVIEALRGGESVFYYGGPGLRYFRALEHVVFGETYLGYL